MSEEAVKGKNLFDEEKIIDTGIKEPLFIKIPFDEYRKYRKLQEENEKLKYEHLEAEQLVEAFRENDLSYLEELSKAWQENKVLKEVHKEFVTLCRELKTDDTLMSAKSVMEKVVSKDKIRTKIKELEESKDKEEYIDEYGVRNIPVLNAFIDLKIEILKELLGDE